MTEQKRHKSGPLRRNLFYYFAIFTLVFIGLLWLFQVATLKVTYKISRYDDIVANGRLLAQSVADNQNANAENIVIEQDTGAIISDGRGEIRIANPRIVENLIGPMNTDEMFKKLESSDQEIVFYIGENGRVAGSGTVKGSLFRRDYLKADAKAIVYGINGVDADGYAVRILVVGSIVPVDATVSTLRNQLIYVTVILLVVAFVLAYFSSRKIAEPITRISQDARELAKGHYDTDFSGKGYAEIEELSDTLNQMAEDLGKVDQMQKELIANVSHDLRTPLTMISGYGELIRDIPEENTPENVQVIIDESNRLTSLVNNMLDISKLQSGNEKLNISVINANDLVYSACTTYQKIMESRGYEFEVDGEENTYYVSGDLIKIQQVLYNLINNAVNHCGNDMKIIIRFHPAGDNIRFDVIDHGEGISKADQALIFNRYYKANNHSRFVTGSGLGLSIVRSIMELHGSRYGVESEPGQGSDFYFELPIVANNE